MSTAGAAGQAVALMDPDLFRRAHFGEVFRALRRHCPVAPVIVDDRTYWHVTGHDAVAAVYQNPGVFSSRGGAIAGSSYRARLDTAADKMLVSADPPSHRYLRTVLQPTVNRSSSMQVAQRIREVLSPRLDQLSARGQAEFMTEVAVELPLAALDVLFGLDRDRGLQLIEITRRIIGYQDDDLLGRHPAAAIPDAGRRLAVLQMEAFAFFDEILDSGLDDRGAVWQQLRQLRLDGHPMPHEEVLYNCLNVAVGGNETTAYTAGHAILALAQSETYDLLLAGRYTPQTVLNEVLRWASTNAYVQRIATAPTMLSAIAIAAGDSVILWNYSANHDESVFEDADVFLPERAPSRRHLTFGMGIHRCVAASLGSLELQTFLALLVEKKVRFAPSGDPTLLRSNFIRGITELPVSVTIESN